MLKKKTGYAVVDGHGNAVQVMTFPEPIKPEEFTRLSQWVTNRFGAEHYFEQIPDEHLDAVEAEVEQKQILDQRGFLH